MKKKTFIVQLLDSKKPSRTSFTQVEDANFYSNDTDASLIFIPHEDTFEFQSAKVVMFNRSDESLVERDMEVTTEDGRKVASYELPDEIISHWGQWVAQPVFINDDEVYSGAIVPFSVIRYLMDNRPPTLRDVLKVDELYSQLVTVMDEIAGKDVISAPEIILARGGENTLGERLDKEHTEVTTQLAQKASQSDVEVMLGNLADATPLFASNVAEMTDTTKLYVNTTDGFLYVHNGTDFATTGVQYQSTGVANESISAKHLVDASTIEEKTNFIKKGKNLFNKDSMTTGVLLVPSGNTSASSSYNVTEYIPVVAGREYTLNNPRHVVFYDVERKFLEYIDNGSVQGLVVVVPTQNGYLRASVQNSRVNTMQMEEGNTETEYESFKRKIPYLEVDETNLGANSVKPKHLRKNSIDYTRTDFLKSGKNLYNRKNSTIGYYIDQGSGILVEVSYYETSDYIRIEKGVTYTISGVRKFILFDLDFNRVRGHDQTQGIYTFTAEIDGFIRFSYRTIDPYGTNVQMEIGDVATEYEPYVLTFPELTLTGGQSLKDDDIKGLVVKKEDDFLTIDSKFGSGEISIRTEKEATGNNVFNFINTTVNGVSIHFNNDDPTPIRTYNTIGANHGYTVVTKFTYAHDKTTTDLGSRWSDGTREYTILDVLSDSIIIGGNYYEVDGEYRALNANPSVNLTHVSGATNTLDIDVSNSSQTQLHPSINHHTLKYFLDGKEIIENGTYSGEELQVRENYNIMSYKGIYDWATSHVGQSYKNDDVPGYVNFSITYSFLPGGKCNVSHTLKPLEKITFGSSGFLQAMPIGSVNYTMYRYMPNVVEKEGYDFKNIVNMGGYNSNLHFSAEDLINPSIPPNRYTDILKDSEGDVLAAYTMGYIVDKTNAKHSDRLQNATTFWDMRSTKKVYPLAIREIVLDVGDYMTFQGYRNYLSAEEIGDATSINIVEDKGDTYVYIDYHKNVNVKNVVIPKHIGKKITVLESENFNLHNDVVDSDGVTFSVSNGYGYAILKVS